MPERPRIPLSFGGGMDRATGIFGVDAEKMLDVRNVYLYRNRMEARKGFPSVNAFLDDAGAAVDDVVAVEPVLSEQSGIVVGYAESDRELHVYRVAGDGAGSNRLGVWGVLPSEAHEPPRVMAAESYRKLFLAHDELRPTDRLSTYYYDPFSGTPLNQLTADLDGAGAAPVYFLGVTTHLNYLVGWGFGSASESNRSEIVRISQPGNPLSFHPEHYVQAGVRDDPVRRCVSMGSVGSPMVVFKQTETYQIFGYDRRTFGIRTIDERYGLAGSKLVVVVNGVAYFWSLEGPRATTGGGPSRDLSWPLDIDAPSPADLVAAGVTEDGFAVYLPRRRVVLFVFGQLAYALSIWNPAEPKWSYWPLGFEAVSGGLLFGSGVAATAPTAAPSAVSGTGTVGTTNTLTVDWTNNSIAGDEFVEVWLKPTGGAWALKGSVLASGATQSTNIAGLDVGTTHAIALRYRRGPYYSPDSSSSNPDDWPAAQKGTGSTLLDAPTIDTLVWARNSAIEEEIAVTFTPAHNEDVVIKRGAAEIVTVTAAQHGGVQYTYHDTGITGETTTSYTLFHRVDVDGATDTDSQWAGPPASPTGFTCGQAAPDIQGQWTNGDVTLETEVWTAVNVNEDGNYALNKTVAAAQTSTLYQDGVTGNTIYANIRHKKTTFTVDDFSPWNNDTALPSTSPCSAVMP